MWKHWNLLYLCYSVGYTDFQGLDSCFLQMDVAHNRYDSAVLIIFKSEGQKFTFKYFVEFNDNNVANALRNMRSQVLTKKSPA